MKSNFLNPENWNSTKSVISGFVIYLVIGNYYLWGNITVYVTSYFRNIKNHNLSENLTNITYTFMMICNTLTMPMGLYHFFKE